LQLKKIIPNLKIIKMPEKARSIKPDGADLFELVQIMTPIEIEEYILNYKEGDEIDPDAPADVPARPDNHSGMVTPFTALGISDDGKAYFLDRDGRLFGTTTETLSKSKLMRLGDIQFYRDYYDEKGRINWDNAIDDILATVGNKDFDTMKIKGRGAWRDNENNVCFHDGIITHGKPNKDFIYLRKPCIMDKIGIFNTPAEPELCKKIANIINYMTFESSLDTIRCISWSIYVISADF
jgi:hypothetical protein